MFYLFEAWTNNLSDYEDEGYSDIDEEESDEEFNQKTEGNNDISISYNDYVCTKKEMLLVYMCHTFSKNVISRDWWVTFRILGIINDQPFEFSVLFLVLVS